jgi:hypothetical protein
MTLFLILEAKVDVTYKENLTLSVAIQQCRKNSVAQIPFENLSILRGWPNNC